MNGRLEMMRTLVLTSVAIIISITTFAQIDRSKAPKAGPAPKVELKKAETFQLDNGLNVIVVENHKLPKVDIQLKFDIPLILQGERAGYIDLAGNLLGSGTRRFSKQDIDEKVDGAGARLWTSKDGLYISSLKKNFDEMMDLVYAIAVSATFPPEEFEKERKRMESGVQQRQDDPDAIASTVAKALTFYKGHPYGEVITTESLSKIDRKNVVAYYERYFTPESGYLVFVGDISMDEARAAAEKYFAEWKSRVPERNYDEQGNEIVDGIGVVRTVSKHSALGKERKVAIVDRPGAAQSLIRVVYPVDLKPGDDMLMAATVMNTILGGGVFNARLMQNLREDKAYTYGAYSSLRSDRYVSGFTASTSVRTEVTRPSVGLILYEMKRMREEEVSQEELNLAKNYLSGQFGRSLEDPKTIARFALNTAINHLPEDHYNTYLERLANITTADVQKAAQRFIHDEKATVLVVGDKEEVGYNLADYSDKQAYVEYDVNGDVYREKTERPPSDLTAEMVIDNYLKAIGGKEKLESVRDLSVRMSTTKDDKEVLSYMIKSKPSNYLYEVTYGGQNLTKVSFNGQKAMVLDEYGTLSEMDQDVFDVAMEAAMFPELEYFNGNNRVTLSGSVMIDGEKAWKLTVQTVNGNVFFEYYSDETGLKLKRNERKLIDMKLVELNTTYKDYRKVEGVMFPHLIKESSKLNLIFTVDEIKLNQGLSPELFKIVD
jgi:predicted Zn-dependent peptidase